jgi:hypothetical protein
LITDSPFDLRRVKVLAKTAFVKRRGSNPKLDTDISEVIGHTDGNETGLGRQGNRLSK